MASAPSWLLGLLALLAGCAAALESPPPPTPAPGRLTVEPSAACEGPPEWTVVTPASVDWTPGPAPEVQHVIDDLLGGGLVAADLTGDGAPDLAFASANGPGAIYRNDGSGGFTRCPDPAWAEHTWALSTFDEDGDGLRELVSLDEQGVRVFPNRGGCDFGEPTLLLPRAHPNDRMTGASWTDFDGDGALDVHIAVRGNDISLDDGQPHGSDLLLRGLPGGGFEDVSDRLGSPTDRRGHGFVGSWLDIDGDGDQDLYVGNDHGALATPNRLFLQDAGGFPEGSAARGLDLAVNAMGVAWGRVEPGGPRILACSDTADLHVLDIDRSPALRVGDAWGVQIDAHPALAAWAVQLEDLDHDGTSELLVVWGWKEAGWTGDVPALRVWDWTGEGLEPRPGWPDFPAHDARALAVVDLDGDGSRELVVTQAFGPPMILAGPCPTGHHGRVALLGAGTNADGLGARVVIEAGGLSWDRRLGVGGRGIYTAQEPVAHFGLGDADRIDRLTVTWPDGVVDSWQDLPVDATITVEQAE